MIFVFLGRFGAILARRYPTHTEKNMILHPIGLHPIRSIYAPRRHTRESFHADLMGVKDFS